MLPTALVQAPNMDDWINLSDVARLAGLPAPASAYPFIIEHRVANEFMFGLRRYYKPDVLAALARKRAAA